MTTPRTAATIPRPGSASAIVLSASLKSKGDGKETKLAFYHAEADHKEERYSSTHSIIGVTDRWQISPDHDLQTAVWLLKKPLKVQDGDTLTVSIGNPALASARVSVTPFSAEDPLEAGLGESLQVALAKSSSSRCRYTASARRPRSARTWRSNC